MEELKQGLVLMSAGMGIVFAFLTVLIFVTKYACMLVAKFNYIFPEPAPKKAAKPAANDDANIALAIAVALG